MAEKFTFSDFYLLTIPLLITLLIAAGIIALNLRLMSLDAEESGTVIVAFPTDYSSANVFDAVLDADGRLINSTWFDSVWVVNSDKAGFVARLKAQGAWGVFNPALLQSITVSGCFVTVAPDA